MMKPMELPYILKEVLPLKTVSLKIMKQVLMLPEKEVLSMLTMDRLQSITANLLQIMQI